MMKVLMTIFYILASLVFAAIFYLVYFKPGPKIVFLVMSSGMTSLLFIVAVIIIFILRLFLIEYLTKKRDKKIAEILERKRLAEKAEDIEEIFVNNAPRRL